MHPLGCVFATLNVAVLESESFCGATAVSLLVGCSSLAPGLLGAVSCLLSADCSDAGTCLIGVVSCLWGVSAGLLATGWMDASLFSSSSSCVCVTVANCPSDVF